LAAGYCRQCSLSLSVDILPVLYITDWSASDDVTDWTASDDDK